MKKPETVVSGRIELTFSELSDVHQYLLFLIPGCYWCGNIAYLYLFCFTFINLFLFNLILQRYVFLSMCVIPWMLLKIKIGPKNYLKFLVLSKINKRHSFCVILYNNTCILIRLFNVLECDLYKSGNILYTYDVSFGV